MNEEKKENNKAILVSCPNCKSSFYVGKHQLEKLITCPVCNAQVKLEIVNDETTNSKR